MAKTKKPATKRKPSKATEISKTKVARKALEDIGLHVPNLDLVLRNSLYVGQDVKVHEVDQTPKLSESLGTSTANCFNSGGLDVGGKAVTDGAGKVTLYLSTFVCLPSLKTAEPVSFVATARSKNPVIMTYTTVSTGDDLVLEVYSWDTSGNPAPGIDFSWRCWTHTPYPPVP